MAILPERKRLQGRHMAARWASHFPGADILCILCLQNYRHRDDATESKEDMMMSRVFICVMCAMMLSACAFTPHEVEITAKAPTEASSIGAGISLYLEVIDDRDSLVTGQRGAGMQGADITAPLLMAALERELTAGFEAKGFRVLSSDAGADVEVEARMRAFKFFIETGFFVGAENTSVVIGIEAERLSDDYDRTYRASSEEAAMFVPAGSSIDGKLNATLEHVLSQIMSDEKLMAFLARRQETS